MNWFKLFSLITAIIGIVIIVYLYLKVRESKNKLDILETKSYLVTFLDKEGEVVVVDAKHGCHRDFSLNHLMSNQELGNWRKEVEEWVFDYKGRYGLKKVTFFIQDINSNFYNKFVH